jgi:hypothetical protein
MEIKGFSRDQTRVLGASLLFATSHPPSLASIGSGGSVNSSGAGGSNAGIFIILIRAGFWL